MTDQQQPDYSWENRHQILASLAPKADEPPSDPDAPAFDGEGDTAGATKAEHP